MGSSPSPRVRVVWDGPRGWWASCRRCTWEEWYATIPAANNAGRDHVPRCGRELYLRPAEFTRSGSSGDPLVIPGPYYESDMEVWL